MVVQNISSNGKETDLTFTIKSENLSKLSKDKFSINAPFFGRFFWFRSEQNFCALKS